MMKSNWLNRIRKNDDYELQSVKYSLYVYWTMVYLLHLPTQFKCAAYAIVSEQNVLFIKSGTE